MKKKSVFYAFGICCCYLIITAHSAGPASVIELDGTGAETGLSNPAGCSVPNGGCHSTSATTGVGINIELDSMGVPVTHYVGGSSYTVILTGTNNTGSSLPKFGFQINSITGSSAKVTPSNAGKWVSPYPANTHYSPAVANGFVVNLVEHGQPIFPHSGSGGQGTTYVQTFNWTAPQSGTGTVSIWAAMNLVNGNGSADAGDKWNTNHIVINERLINSGIQSPDANSFNMKVFPNPCRSGSDKLNFSYSLGESGRVVMQLYDLSGRLVCELLNETQPAGDRQISIPVPAGLTAGIYLLNTAMNDNRALEKIIIDP